MTFEVTASRGRVAAQMNRNEQEVDPAGETGQKAGAVALKILAGLGKVLGFVAAIAGAALATKFAISSGLIVPLVLAGAATGTTLLYYTSVLCTNPITSLGAVVTLPAAGVAFGAPFVFPAFAGALPGIGLMNLSSWAWKALA
ncbi:hypothetical protein [Estrella lausannensis]|uniref:Putative membrane protein n=1 Tax=Estrella lausannensis TaxID=483423 RepID=A0A0H5DRB4_9BACT|nr:hypothetical protein [Estrella lausannensis]CRX38209.1 putative membrane protein [Estrella lausannensis]